MNTFLRELAFEYTLLLDKTVEEKQELINFVENATDLQIKTFLLSEGQVLETLTEEENRFVEQIFAASPLGVALSEIGAEDPFSAAGKISGPSAGQQAGALVKQGSAWVKTLIQKLKGYEVSGGAEGGGGVHVQGQISKILGTTQGKVVAAAIMAALIALVARKAYKAFFSKAAKACKGQADKKACMQKAKAQAAQAQIKELQASAKGCDATKNPAKCKAAIQKKIAVAKQKMAK